MSYKCLHVSAFLILLGHHQVKCLWWWPN